MGRESQVPWFPAWGIEFSNPIDDILAIVLEFNSFRPSNRWLLVAFDAIASEMHLWTTWYSMRRREVSGSMVAKTPDAEFLRKVSGTHQISRAFERAGLRKGDGNAWIVFLPEFNIGNSFGDFSIPFETYNEMSLESERLVEVLDGRLLPLRPTPSLKGLERLGMEDIENSPPSEIEGLFLSWMAQADLR